MIHPRMGRTRCRERTTDLNGVRKGFRETLGKEGNIACAKAHGIKKNRKERV